MILTPDKIKYRPQAGRIKVKPASAKKFDENMTEDNQDLMRAYNLWNMLDNLRERRRRCIKFVNGDQWSDKFWDPESKNWITGDQYIRSQGRVPLVQNLIGPTLENVVGQYRSNAFKGMVISRSREKQNLANTMTGALEAELDYNQAKELDAQLLRELYQGGICVSKVQWDYDETIDNEVLSMENPIINRMFMDSGIEDIRINKFLSFIGEFHDWTIDYIVQRFAKTPQEERIIRGFYPINVEEYQSMNETFSGDKIDNLSFLLPTDFNHGRVYEIWKKVLVWRMRVHDPADASIQVVDMTEAQLQEINALRLENAIAAGVPAENVPLLNWMVRPERVWVVKYLTPWGHRLYAAENPYKHQSHPYVVTVKTSTDGRISIPVENMIPLQVSINRMVTMRDFIIGNSAKGLLMVPEGSIPEGMNLNDFSAEWTKANGVVMYKPLPGGQVPQQISANSVPVGINEQISLSMQLFFQISGITQAAQGMKAAPGTPAALYAQEAQNSIINLRDLFERFASHKQERDYKAIQLIQQFRNDQYYIAVGGKDVREQDRIYNPEEIKNVKFNYSVTESNNTAVFRQGMEESLFSLLQGQFIDVKMFLENSSQPWAERLLDAINKREAQQPSPEEMQMALAQANQQANPKAIPMINQVAGKPSA